jgi:hypothetical protein
MLYLSWLQAGAGGLLSISMIDGISMPRRTSIIRTLRLQGSSEDTEARAGKTRRFGIDHIFM